MLDVLIVGSGPHALSLATLLSCHDTSPRSPGASVLQGVQLSKGSLKPGRGRSKRRQPTTQRPVVEGRDNPALPPRPPLLLRVVDSYGEWASLWESQFSALNIPHLRSHTLVHTDPLNKKALQEFVLNHKRVAELHSLPDSIYIQDENAFFNDNRLGKRERRLLSSSRGLQRKLYFSLPGTQLSVDFFREQVHRYGLDSILMKGTVERIVPVKSGEEALFFRVSLQDGQTIEARGVVMATGPTRAQMANIPDWVSAIEETYPEESLQHTVQLMHHLTLSRQQETANQQQETESTGPPLVCKPGQKLLVVGGGLTSAHILSIALQQGASHVTWVLRKHVQLKQFDVGDVESLIGRYSHVEHGIKMDGLAYLRQFYSERSLHKRLAMIRQARKGGAVTPEAYAKLQPFIETGQLCVRAYCQVSEAKWDYKSQSWLVSLSCGEQWSGDRIWLATGCKLDVNQDPLLSDVIKEFPIQVLDGWPCISETLRWAPQCPLYLMGQYAALQIGPHAVNLAGGQAASWRIAKDLIGRHSGGVEPGTAEKSRTEEYLSQMHGLMWL